MSGSPADKQFLLEEMGCGVAFFDYDNDGWLDIFLVNGSSFDPEGAGQPTRQLPLSQQPRRHLHRCHEEGRADPLRLGPGLLRGRLRQRRLRRPVRHLLGPERALPQQRRRHVYRRLGEGRRRRIRHPLGRRLLFLDYDRDGHLDLFVANYVNFDPAKAPRPGQSAYCRYNEIPVPCGPQGFAGGTNILYRNRGDGTFADVSEPSGIARPRGPSSMVFVAQRTGGRSARTGWERRRRTSTTTAGRTSTSPATPRRACSIATTTTGRSGRSRVPAGIAFDENGVALAGMGVGVGDYDADGWLDIVRTNFSEQVTILYRNYGGAFEDASIKAGLGVNRKYVGFGVDFFDFDNDGWSDIFIANGHVYSQIAGKKLHLVLPAAAAALSEPRQRPIPGCVLGGGPRNNRGESRPRMCVRRLRQ